MPNQRDEEQENKPLIIDRRLLNDDERAGKSSAQDASSTQQSAPKLEIIGGGNRAQSIEPNDVPDAPQDDSESDDEPMLDPSQPAPMGEPNDDEFPPMTAEEEAEMRAQMEAAEQEQFAELEQRMGRPLTAKEKDQVRQEMARQTESMISLDVGPVLQQFLGEMSARAAVHMGLMPNPYTRLIARNDAQARVAIEAFGAICDVIKPNLDPASAKEVTRVLDDLRVNYQSITGVPINMGGAATSPLIDKPRIIH